MNYILITPRVRLDLTNSEKYDRELSLSTFLSQLFNTGNRGILYNKISEEPLRIKIWSSTMNLTLEEINEKNAFKTVVLRDNTFEKFNSMLKYCNVLSGQWDFALISSEINSSGDYDYLRNEESHNEKISEFDKYNKYWLNYDIITKKKEEKSKKIQQLSITKYNKFIVNFDKEEISIQLIDKKYNFKVADRVILSKDLTGNDFNKNEVVMGEVVKVKSNLNIVIKVKSLDKLNEVYGNKEFKKGYIYLDEVGTMAMLNRQKRALKSLFNKETANKRLKDFMPNIKNLPSTNISYNENNLEEINDKLNVFQMKAVNGALSCSDIFLIQGPPGTGKTTVICEIIKQIVKKNENVLISSQSHLAVDNVLQRIGESNKVNALRIGNEDKIELDCDKYLLNNRAINIQEKILANLVDFDNQKEKMVQQLNEIRDVNGNYKLAKNKMKLIINLLENYKKYKESYEKSKSNLENIELKLSNLDKFILNVDSNILNNKNILKDLSKVLDEYDEYENLSELYLNIDKLNLSEYDLELIENFNVIVEILKIKIEEYENLIEEKNKILKMEKEYKEQFEIEKGQIFSLSDQYDTLSSDAVRSAILIKIDELKYNLSELKESYKENNSKINNVNNRLDNKIEEIHECKKNGLILKTEIESILMKNIDICKNKKHMLEMIKLKKYLDLKFNDNKVFKLLKWIDKYKEIENILIEIKENSKLKNMLNNDMLKEFKIIEKIEEKLNEYAIDENIKYILNYKNKSIYDINEQICLELEKLDIEYNNLVNKVQLIEKTKDLRNELKERLNTYQSSFEDMYVELSNVICATCSGIASTNNNNFSSKEFDYVIIDEAAKCFSSELLIPMIKGKKIILVGDHKQISPIIEKDILLEMEQEELVDNNEKELYFNSSLFGITFDEADENLKITLNKQYRMNSDISTFISKQFYKSELKDGENIINIKYGIGNMNKGLYWIDSGEVEKSRETLDGTSYYNKKETEIIIKCLTWLDKEYLSKKEIGIISPYKAQKEYLNKIIENLNLVNLELEINTIDAFQGREKDIILMNLVRNNEKGQFGHVAGDSRVNVALSRAKELCLIVGNENFILNNKNRSRSLYNLFKYAKENNMRLSENNFKN